MLIIDWPLTIVVATALAVLVGVVGGYLSARLAVIGSERRLNQSLRQSVARSLDQQPADV